jgi:GrpB-like predicted nucleotidyltransferase (UPF0157 family)
MNQIDEEIELTDYNPKWPAFFDREKSNLEKIFKHACQKIEHFGSTAVPGMTAKPIIGILIGIEELSLDEQILQVLKNNGYEYLGEAGVPGRLAFRKRGQQNFNLAVVKYGSDLWTNGLLIRDFLQDNETYKQKYIKVKKEAIQKGFDTLLAYSKYKKVFVEKLLAKARQNRQH